MHNINLTVIPASGDVFATNFTAFATVTGTSIAKYIWNFGDSNNLIYDKFSNAEYIYNYPGVFTVSVTAVDFDGYTTTTVQTITADLAYRDYVKFSQIPEKYPDPGKLTDIPFKVDIVSSQINKPLVIDLFATNSFSTPQQFVSDRWNFLNPTWKFLDTNLNFITSLTANPVPLYKNNVVVGVSSTVEFYYVDSVSTTNPVEQCPVLITATLQTSSFNNPQDSSFYSYPGHANNQTVRSGVLWQINDLFPNLLKVTSNYIDKIQSPQWTSIPIPALITCHSNRNLILSGSDDSISEVIFSYPKTNTQGKNAPVLLSLKDVSNNDYTIDEAPLYFQATDNNSFKSGGYIFTTITSFNTAVNTSIVAHTTAFNGENYNTDNTFFYPKGYAPNTSVWISNPSRNTLNKITLVPYSCSCPTVNYFIDNKILVDGQIKQIEVPYITENNTYNYQMSGFSGIYGIAIDPRKYDIIACDSELDRIYRISNTGNILKTFELSSLGDYDPFRKMMDTWYYTTPAPELSSTKYVLYNNTPITNNTTNFIVQIEDKIQPIDISFVDAYDRILAISLAPNYPLEGLNVDIVQLFSPALPNDYISTLFYWTTSSSVPITIFNLSTSQPLFSNPNYYLVIVDGLIQSPYTYNIDNINNTITFLNSISPNSIVQIRYIPKLNDPTTALYTFNTPTTSILLPLATNSSTTTQPIILPWQDDPQNSFIISVNGVYLPPRKYQYNYSNQQIIFTETIPSNTTIQITQLSIPDKVYIPQAYTPSYISIDKEYNIWVSLFNSISVLKFDENFNLLHTVTPPSISWSSEPWTVLPQNIDYQVSRFGKQSPYINDVPNTFNLNVESAEFYINEYFLKPPVVETDKENNCWVTYAHPLCCILAKYNSSGTLIGQINLPRYTIPINLTITPDNNIWVANTHNSSYTYTALSGSLQLYNSSNFQLLSTVTGFTRPQYIALDRSSNVWFTHGQRRIGVVNAKTKDVQMWTLELTGGFTTYEIPTATSLLELIDQDTLNQDEDLNGLAVDVFDRVWVIDGLQNYVWVLSATPNFLNSPMRYFKITPDSTIGYYVDINTGDTFSKSEDAYYKSAQATGDWTGNRWYQKYVNVQNLSSISLSGISEQFNIEPFENINQIRRINESFNMSEYLHSLALPENLYNNSNLFNNFLAGVVGTGELSAYEDLGQILYEKIANFTINHADVDTCNIDQLLSLAAKTDTPASDYGATYPREIRDLIDIASISRSRLWGIKDEIPVLPRSTGSLYNTQTDFITADTKIILKSKLDNTYSLIPVPPQDNGTLIYPLSEFIGYGFTQPVLINYQFYSLNPQYDNTYLDNIIDWDSSNTFLSPNLSSFEQWYGSSGIIENLFRYVLTKNLFTK